MIFTFVLFYLGITPLLADSQSHTPVVVGTSASFPGKAIDHANHSQEDLLAKKFFTCKKDSDCVLIPPGEGCCSCENGAEPRAINKNHIEQFRTWEKTVLCKDVTACTESYECNNSYQVTCKDSFCKAIRVQADTKNSFKLRSPKAGQRQYIKTN